MLRRIIFFFLVFFGLSISFSPVFASETEGTIDETNRYAWTENAGWIDFGQDGAATITITDDELTGYAWGENIGWIILNCETTDSCAENEYAVENDAEGNLSGYAWSENVGWIDFDPEGGGVTISENGIFSGYAWGEDIGWIVFNCSTTDSCAEIEYYIETDWRPLSARAAEEGEEQEGEEEAEEPEEEEAPLLGGGGSSGPSLLSFPSTKTLTPKEELPEPPNGSLTTAHPSTKTAVFPLNLVYNDTATYITISNDADFAFSSRRAVQKTILWDLCPAQIRCPARNYSVYAYYSNSAGEKSAVRQIDIFYAPNGKILEDIEEETETPDPNIQNPESESEEPESKQNPQRDNLVDRSIVDIRRTVPISEHTEGNNLAEESRQTKEIPKIFETPVEISPELQLVLQETVNIILDPVIEPNQPTTITLSTTGTVERIHSFLTFHPENIASAQTENSGLASTLRSLLSVETALAAQPKTEAEQEEHLLVLEKIPFEQVAPQQYEGNFVAPKDPGVYEVINIIEYTGTTTISKSVTAEFVVISHQNIVYETDSLNGVKRSVPNARITVYKLNKKTQIFEPWSPSPTEAALEIVTDLSGLFTLQIPPGTYSLQVEAAGFIPSRTSPFLVTEKTVPPQKISLEQQKKPFPWIKILVSSLCFLFISLFFAHFYPIIKKINKLFNL